MDLDAFHRLFGAAIRAWLAWDELGDDVRIRQQVITDRSELGRLLTVWYTGPEGEPGNWRESTHTPMTVDQAASTPTSWTAGAAERVGRFQSLFLSGQEPPVLLFPAYAIGDRVLLLDGSHRAIALHRTGLGPQVLVCAVAGPVDHRVLPDLGRWSSNLDPCAPQAFPTTPNGPFRRSSRTG